MAQEELRKERSRYSAALEIELDNCLAAWLRLKDLPGHPPGASLFATPLGCSIT